MKIKYFPDTDTFLLEFNDSEVHETKEISENVYVDLDKNGLVVAITIEHAKASTKEPWGFSYEEIAAQAA